VSGFALLQFAILAAVLLWSLWVAANQLFGRSMRDWRARKAEALRVQARLNAAVGRASWRQRWLARWLEPGVDAGCASASSCGSCGACAPASPSEAPTSQKPHDPLSIRVLND